MNVSRRGLIFGAGAVALTGCATSGGVVTPTVVAAAPTPPPVQVATAPLFTPPLDPSGKVPSQLMARAMAALDVHSPRLPNRDRMYLVDFTRFSGEERFFEVDLIRGEVTGFRTSHGRGSDPEHSGFARRFSDQVDSHMSSVGAFATAGPNWGPQQGPNVLLDGLEYTNVSARERAIIVHGADYAEPSFLDREGKLGRSYGCFSTSHADLQTLRDRMGEGRLLFAWA